MLHFTVSNTHRDVIYSHESLPIRVWELVVEVMDLFENVKLKGQKLNMSSLLTKPEFKQQCLATIWGLKEDDQVTLLRKVVSGVVPPGTEDGCSRNQADDCGENGRHAFDKHNDMGRSRREMSNICL